ncbi:MAG: glutamate racemase [Myxococcota bacterium]
MIGVYDSGFGGLTVLRELVRVLPERSFLYLGDNGRAPYGGRDVHTVIDFAEQSVEHLFDAGCRLVVVACNTVSCVALRHLQQRYAPPDGSRRVLGVTIPGAELATQQSRGHIGILATRRTVESRTYCAEIAKLSDHRVTQRSAPLLAHVVEEGFESHDIARLALQEYLADLTHIDTLLLGCTHYPLLRPLIEAVLPDDVSIVDPGPYVATALRSWLDRHPSFDTPDETGSLRMLTSGSASDFTRLGVRFFGGPLPEPEPLTEQDGRLVVRGEAPPLRGQVVRPSRR